jgi:hypothetical protein
MCGIVGVLGTEPRSANAAGGASRCVVSPARPQPCVLFRYRLAAVGTAWQLTTGAPIVFTGGLHDAQLTESPRKPYGADTPSA